MLINVLTESQAKAGGYDKYTHTPATLAKALAKARWLMLANADGYERGDYELRLMALDVKVTAENFLRLVREGLDTFSGADFTVELDDLWNAITDEEITKAKKENAAEKETFGEVDKDLNAVEKGLDEIEAETSKKPTARGKGGRFTTASVRNGLLNATRPEKK